MQLLIVTAHPETQSFNFAMRERAATVAARVGAGLSFSDLYQQGFAPTPGRADFQDFPATQSFDLAQAQKAHQQHGGFALDIQAEQEKLEQADAVILQFPLWWGGYPAVLKGWIERVLSYGFAYGRDKTLPAKKVLLAVTTGGIADEQDAQRSQARLQAMADDVFGYMGWRILGLHLVHGPADLDAEQRAEALNSYAERLRLWLSEAVPLAA
ncbi:NAD(P)H-dependent oxidoreductase [Roseateles oligotrophus]|uniref:NAD(P)H-dependent oxidoreductase n=1 Tax=Roseateles oligotrophus TaxID=1769250 RepID=A0ABT2YL37_9BURK|nr:NAD(P)H-dependent oxidoreductase [Roseateles oligotrophus]MCV2370761.1 NAD(P)H-dependent oxidoreductase [Roseateles oligotrophus]